MKLLTALVLLVQPAIAQTLVPLSQQIGDRQARLEWARSLAAAKGHEEEALNVLGGIARPDDAEVLALRADLNLRLGRRMAAERDLRELAKLKPKDTGVALALGNLLAARGHARESRTWFNRAVGPDASEKDRRLLASQMQGWGDFTGAERILTSLREKESDDISLELEWAALLRGQQRFFEAREAYKEVLRTNVSSRPAWQGLATTCLLAKDYAAARAVATAGLARLPGDTELLLIRARALMSQGENTEAAVDFGQLAGDGLAEGWIGLGRLAEQSEEKPETHFLKAEAADPLGAAYFRARRVSGEEPRFPASLSANSANLSRWGELLLGDGLADAASQFFAKALSLDPEYFPAQMGVAESAASAKRYAEALAQLERMRGVFPQNFKIELTRARILSWSKDYKTSVEAYDEILGFAPDHPVVQRERARVLAWAKKMRAATGTYARLWENPVDEKILAELPSAVTSPHRRSKPYAVFEALDRPDAQPAVRKSLDRHRAEYQIQKSAWLESAAKNHAWNRHFLRAEDDLEPLVEFEPGNQEARFDLAQAQAVQNLSRRAVATYRGLLSLDPLHQQAGLALEREEILNDPALSVSYLLLDEKGTDRLADITRQRIQASIEYPWSRQTTLRLSSFTWFESPDRFAETYMAIGPGLEVTSTFNEYLTGSATFVYKNYLDPGIRDTFGGSAALALNLWDWATITAAYEHADVIHNSFAIWESTQADSVQLMAKSFLNRWVELAAVNSVRIYNDNNTGFEGLYTAGILLLDHPHTLKLVIGGEYRNTENMSQPVFEDGVQVAVIHPYWTPQNYVRGLVSLEWRHDLSRFFFAHAETHYYVLRVRGSYDNDSNPSLGGEIEWHIDFARRWSFHAIASVERSPQWNGAGVFTSITCRF